MKKIIYSVMFLVGISVFAIILIRGTYQSNFLFGQTESAQALSVSSVSSAINKYSQSVLSDSLNVTHVNYISNKNLDDLNLPILLIPSINVDAHIENVGISSDGTMSVPPRLVDVGWYEYGTQIGNVGSAVIAGHVDNALTLPAVFYNLKKVKVGDDVYVIDKNNNKLHFVIVDVSSYSISSAPKEEIFNDTSGQRLIRLITCDKVLRSNGMFGYDNRIVVTAKLILPN